MLILFAAGQDCLAAGANFTGQPNYGRGFAGYEKPNHPQETSGAGNGGVPGFTNLAAGRNCQIREKKDSFMPLRSSKTLSAKFRLYGPKT